MRLAGKKAVVTAAAAGIFTSRGSQQTCRSFSRASITVMALRDRPLSAMAARTFSWTDKRIVS